MHHQLEVPQAAMPTAQLLTQNSNNDNEDYQSQDTSLDTFALSE
jgi:hypothetical protein